MASYANAFSPDAGFRSHEPASPAADAKLSSLVALHDGLDFAISALLKAGNYDDLVISRLKKRKLRLKDEISCCIQALS
jgi:uncharacterized protein YdcH (DUF465 family)